MFPCLETRGAKGEPHHERVASPKARIKQPVSLTVYSNLSITLARRDVHDPTTPVTTTSQQMHGICGARRGSTSEAIASQHQWN